MRNWNISMKLKTLKTFSKFTCCSCWLCCRCCCRCLCCWLSLFYYASLPSYCYFLHFMSEPMMIHHIHMSPNISLEWLRTVISWKLSSSTPSFWIIKPNLFMLNHSSSHALWQRVEDDKERMFHAERTLCHNITPWTMFRVDGKAFLWLRRNKKHLNR